MTVSTVLREMENTPVLVQLGFADQHTNNNQVHKHVEHVSLLLLSQQLKHPVSNLKGRADLSACTLSAQPRPYVKSQLTPRASVNHNEAQSVNSSLGDRLCRHLRATNPTQPPPKQTQRSAGARPSAGELSSR